LILGFPLQFGIEKKKNQGGKRNATEIAFDNAKTDDIALLMNETRKGVVVN